MRAYELMVIFESGLDDQAIDDQVKSVASQIAARGATVASTDRWGRRRFAYEIDHKTEGYYVVWELTSDGADLEALERSLRLADEVVRHKLVRLPDREAARRGLLGEQAQPAPRPDKEASMADNTVTVIGNVTRDPELRFTPSGQAIATFGLAVNRRWQNRTTNEWEEQVSFFDVTCWAQLGQNVSDTLVKGSRAIVTGRLEQRSWETDQGDKRSKVEIIADEVGPSLRWATAEITRNERRDGDAPSGGGGASSRPVPNAAPAGYDPAEEPF